VGKSQFGDKKFFTENFLYYIDFFGWEMMIKEGKKAPGQMALSSIMVFLQCYYNTCRTGQVFSFADYR
jgi:hypothetical protein